MRGQLLDLKRFSDGTFKATLLSFPTEPELSLPTVEEAQAFISTWYAPINARASERHGPSTGI